MTQHFYKPEMADHAISLNILQLYGTSGCHLCEQAQTICYSLFGRAVTEVDIATDDMLLERYATVIPVLVRLDTGAELKWPFDSQALTLFLV